MRSTTYRTSSRKRTSSVLPNSHSTTSKKTKKFWLCLRITELLHQSWTQSCSPSTSEAWTPSSTSSRNSALDRPKELHRPSTWSTPTSESTHLRTWLSPSSWRTRTTRFCSTSPTWEASTSLLRTSVHSLPSPSSRNGTLDWRPSCGLAQPNSSSPPSTWQTKKLSFLKVWTLLVMTRAILRNKRLSNKPSVRKPSPRDLMPRLWVSSSSSNPSRSKSTSRNLPRNALRTLSVRTWCNLLTKINTQWNCTNKSTDALRART